MTRDEAIGLAKRICNCWHGGPPHNEWADYLAGLDDPERAGRVFLRFRGELEHTPTFKRFGEVYRALAHTANVIEMPERPLPKLSREERNAILAANGAPERYTKERTR
jgi:hypothetical protein